MERRGGVRRELPPPEPAHRRRSRRSARRRNCSTCWRASHGACGIVYCGSRAKTERIAQRLAEKGFPAIAFHAGLEPGAKRTALARFRSGEPVVIVATIAFGMGIDRPDVRFVVHLDMPDSPEAYYQQIGRAGRDGDPAHTLLLYGGEDIARARHWLAQSAAPEAQKRVMRARLEAMVALTETSTCRTRALLACFGEELAADAAIATTAPRPPVTFDGTVEAQKVLSAVYRTDQMFGACISSRCCAASAPSRAAASARPAADFRRRRAIVRPRSGAARSAS